jgi:hypothetical protein
MQKNDTLVFNGITAQDFEIYTGHNWKIIDSIISSKEFTDSNIHKIRKFMKDIYYNTQVIKKLNARKTGSEDENINTKLQYFDKLLEDLGNFQDVCTSIELLDPHLLHSLNFSTQEFLAHIKKLFIDEKNAMKVSSVEKLADYSARNGSLIDDTTSEQQQLSVVQ